MTKAIIVVSFGTTYPDTRKKTIQACEETIQQRFPDFQVHRAFTSNVVIKRIKENEGISVPTVNQLLEQLKKVSRKFIFNHSTLSWEVNMKKWFTKPTSLKKILNF